MILISKLIREYITIYVLYIHVILGGGYLSYWTRFMTGVVHAFTAHIRPAVAPDGTMV